MGSGGEPTVLRLPVQLPGVEGACVAARCFPPDPAAAARLPEPIWIFATPGAGADWRYWDLRPPGREGEGYSFAEFMARRGMGVVAIDTLGIGDSRFPADGALLTFETIGAAHAQAVAACRELLATGALIRGMAALAGARWFGIGHSGGAGMTMIVQALHASFDMVGLVGMPADDFDVAGGADSVRSVMRVNAAGLLTMALDLGDEASRWTRAASYLDDVPDDVILASPPCPLPASYPDMMGRGALLSYAREISCPVFLGFAEVDFAGSPFEEPGRFAKASDVSVYIQPGCAHQHNHGATRAEMWGALYNWGWGRTRFRNGARPNTAPREATRPMPRY